MFKRIGFTLLLSFTFMMFLFVVFARPAGAGQPPHFDDMSNPDKIVLDTTYYKISLNKRNGAIISIIDKLAGQNVIDGSHAGCLWVTGFTNGYTGGCHYDLAWSNLFTYTWSGEPTNTLTLSYIPDPTVPQQVTVTVVITTSEDYWFDTQLQVQNKWGYTLTHVQFPSDLIFDEHSIAGVYLPILPGVVLEQNFFADFLLTNRGIFSDFMGLYPGHFFADYVHITSTHGQLAMYALHERQIAPVEIGFRYDSGDPEGSSPYMRHTFRAMTPDGHSWTSPKVRIRIGQPVAETVQAYRQDNHFDQYPSLKQKLGPDFQKVAQAPVYKLDVKQVGIPCTAYKKHIFEKLPTPGILHLVTYWTGAFDENYPDFLPPDPAWCTPEAFQEMLEQAQAHGLLVMVYINPTWWDENSLTLSSSHSITDIAVLDQYGRPRRECYDARCGVVVSPWSPFVQQRLEKLFEELAKLPIDIVFLDQVCAREWLSDFNPHAPSPMAYIEGWREFMRTYSNTFWLASERGFDFCAESVIGLHGSVLLDAARPLTDEWWGNNNWHPYPLVMGMLRDKTFFYQHNLAPETMAHNKGNLTRSVLYGFMLSYNLYQEGNFGGGLHDAWLDVASLFQKNVLALYADELMVDFTEDVSAQVLQALYERFAITANLDKQNNYDTGKHTLPPEGSLIQSTDGSVTAGVFTTTYNASPLSPGEHYLIEIRNPCSITLWQPIGGDTDITLDLLASCDQDKPIGVFAYDQENNIISSVPFTLTAQGMTFTYRQKVNGKEVVCYRYSLNSLYLPVILK